MYSDISTRIIACSSPKTASASAFVISVLPTPVGPKKRKEPIGRCGSFNPTRPLLTALATALTASSCPTTRLCSVFSRRLRRAASPSASLFTGIFVQSDTISAISFSPTTSFFLSASRWYFSTCFSYFFRTASFSLRIAPASSNRCSINAVSISSSN